MNRAQRIAWVFVVTTTVAAWAAQEEPDVADLARRAVADGRLAFKLTTPDEFKALFGEPTQEATKADGGMETLALAYPDVQAMFGRMRTYSVPFTLLAVGVRGEGLDIGQDRQIVLRSAADLKKFDPFWGLANVSLAGIDLTDQGELLAELPFDNRTSWPSADKLPEGLDPIRLLEDGKNPGLGGRALHQQGVDGRGVGIAIIDQPLLKDHVEYADRIVRYERIAVGDMEPQMHGPPVTSIAAGKTCGVAPAATLTYFAVPMWERDNTPYCDAIDKIIALNKAQSDSPRIRVVSISTGMFAKQKHYDRWKESLKKAEEHGILVVTCAQEAFGYGMVGRAAGGDPDDPADYESGLYGVRPGVVLVPASNRTVASHVGPNVYTYWRQAGMSWATPYLAGVAALAYQVHPDIRPAEIGKLLSETATRTDVGLIVNPAAFVEAARKLSAEGR